MNTQDVMVLNWTFSPPEYFEQQIIYSRDRYTVKIQDGKIDASMELSVYDSNPTIKDVIEDSLNQRFRGVQLILHRPYELTFAGRLRLHPDGHSDIFITPATATLRIRSGIADITVTNKNGMVRYDSRKERIEKKSQLAELADKHGTDALARALLASYDTAVSDPDNELVHLFEIRDALAKKFGGTELACTELGVNGAEWSELGRLANEEPIKQGRHRGKHAGELRTATEGELDKAREIARNMILAYLSHLDKSHS